MEQKTSQFTLIARQLLRVLSRRHANDDEKHDYYGGGDRHGRNRRRGTTTIPVVLVLISKFAFIRSITYRSRIIYNYHRNMSIR